MPAWGCGAQFENLPPFSGQLFPVGSGPPLSALKQISVSSYSPDVFKSSTTRPIAASIQFTIEWYFWREGLSMNENLAYCASGTCRGPCTICGAPALNSHPTQAAESTTKIFDVV